MDGAFGFSRERKLRLRKYMSSVALKIVKGCLSKNEYLWKDGKGGIWRFWDKRIKKFILAHNVPGNHLLVIGKSAGGRDTCEILKKVIKKSNYDSIQFLMVDADWPFLKGKLEVPLIDRVVNIYQTNPGLGGTKVKTKSHLKELSLGKSVNHFDIVDHKIVKDYLRVLINNIKED